MLTVSRRPKDTDAGLLFGRFKQRRSEIVAKGQMRPNKETRKPKKEKVVAKAPVTTLGAAAKAADAKAAKPKK